VFVRFRLGVYRFLSSSTTATAIAMIMAIVETVKYVSTGACGTGVGSGVAAGASSTPR
jgi:hypothetical protein